MPLESKLAPPRGSPVYIDTGKEVLHEERFSNDNLLCFLVITVTEKRYGFLMIKSTQMDENKSEMAIISRIDQKMVR